MDQGETQAAKPIGAAEALQTMLNDMLNGTGLTIFQDLTSEAYVDLLHILRGLSDFPPMEDFSVEGHEVVGEDHRFFVRFQFPEKDIDAVTTLRQVRSSWKIASIKVPGIRE